MLVCDGFPRRSWKPYDPVHRRDTSCHSGERIDIVGTVINQILRAALQDGVSDIFLAAGEPVRVRRHGSVAAMPELAVTADDMNALAESCGFRPDAELDGDARYEIDTEGTMRVNFYYAMGQLRAVLRPLSSDIPALDSLGAPAELLRDWMTRDSGLILVTGPTGAGKSTTLAALLDDYAHREPHHIVTVEDPIEYLFRNREAYFSQREVKTDTAGFPQALRAALRQNPDVILIGEIRDPETAAIALRAAETGHLVLATVHSSGVVETIERLTNLFPSEDRVSALNLLSRQLVGVLTQFLLPSANGQMALVTEFLQNEAGMREWIRTSRYPEMEDAVLGGDGIRSKALLTSLVEAVNAGQIEHSIARAASRNTGDFDRAISGII